VNPEERRRQCSVEAVCVGCSECSERYCSSCPRPRRFIFDDTPRVDIYLGNIRVSTKLTTPDGVNDSLSLSFDAEDVAEASMEALGWYPVDDSTAGPGPAVHAVTPVRYEAVNADISSGNSNHSLPNVLATYSSLNLFTPQAELFQLETKEELISNLSVPSNDLSEISFMVSAADYQKLLAAPALQIKCGNKRWVILTGP
jgi:hypothetical protein